MEQNLNILGTQNAFKEVLANRVNSILLFFLFVHNQIIILKT